MVSRGECRWRLAGSKRTLRGDKVTKDWTRTDREISLARYQTPSADFMRILRVNGIPYT